MANSEFAKGDVIKVAWFDSVQQHGWSIPMSAPLLHESIGKLWSMDNERIVLTTTFDNSGLFACSPLHIPMRCVESVVPFTS